MTDLPDAATAAAARDAFFDWSKRNHIAGQEVWFTFRDGFTAGVRAGREQLKRDLERARHGDQPAGVAT